MLCLASCGDGRAGYRSIRDAAASADGAAIFLAVEQGETTIEGNLFSGHTATYPKALELHRFDLASRALTPVRTQPPAAGYGGGSSLTVAFLDPTLAARPLPRCADLLSTCAEGVVPAAYFTYDAVAVPAARTLLAAAGDRLVANPLPFGDADGFRAAADARIRHIVSTLRTEGPAMLASRRATDAQAPRQREDHGSDALFREPPGVVASYRLFPDGLVLGQFVTGAETSFVAWPNDTSCLTNDPRVTRAVDGCVFAAVDSFGAVPPPAPPK